MDVILDNYLITISIIVISFFTAMITSLAGAGGGTILLAYMLQFINPLVAIPIHGTVQLTSNIARVFLFRKYLVWKLIIPFCMFLPFGVYLGLTIFQNLDSQKIKFLIGAFIISTIVFQNIKKNKKVRMPTNFYYFLGFFPKFVLEFPCKNKNIQALVNFYVFLIQHFECKPVSIKTFF